MKKSERVKVEMHKCISAEYEWQDARLGVAALALAARLRTH